MALSKKPSGQESAPSEGRPPTLANPIKDFEHFAGRLAAHMNRGADPATRARVWRAMADKRRARIERWAYMLARFYQHKDHSGLAELISRGGPTEDEWAAIKLVGAKRKGWKRAKSGQPSGPRTVHTLMLVHLAYLDRLDILRATSFEARTDEDQAAIQCQIDGGGKNKLPSLIEVVAGEWVESVKMTAAEKRAAARSPEDKNAVEKARRARLARALRRALNKDHTAYRDFIDREQLRKLVGWEKKMPRRGGRG
jgi:hypothetical protein